MLQYNQEAALEVGAGGFIQESGFYGGGKIVESKFVTAGNGAQGVELSFESADGLKANYLTIYYRKADGTDNKYGLNLINAIMGVTKTPQMQSGTELSGKPIGLALQKVLYSKKDGSDGYKFEVKIPFVGQTNQTLKEALEAAQPTVFGSYEIKDKDERGQNTGQAPMHGQNPPMGTQDDYNW